MLTIQQKQRAAFLEFLKHGFHKRLIPGVFTYQDVVRLFNLSQQLERPERGVAPPWFQDLYLWFDENGILSNIEIRLQPLIAHLYLPRALDFAWFDFASQFTPETFEQLVIKEQVPCKKATHILDEKIYPAIYCLDHLDDKLGMMPRFHEANAHTLFRIDIRLLENFPILAYQSVWP